MKYLTFIILLLSTTVLAQGYNTGLPVPGLPKSVGPKRMSGSTSVTFATDQTPLQITGTVTVSGGGGGSSSGGVTNFNAAFPVSGTAVGFKSQSGLMVPITLTANGAVPVNNSGVTGTATSVSISGVTTEIAPATAIGFIIEAIDTNTANLRFAVGSTASSTVGIQLQPGRSEWLPVGANISVCPESGTQSYTVQWANQ